MSILRYAPEALKNLFRKPVTINYPAEPYQYPKGSRGHIEIEIDRCISCGMCVRSCPSGALAVDRNKGTWTINRFDCIACGYCVVKCPTKCLSILPGYQVAGQKAEETFTKSPEQMAKEAAKKAAAAEKAAAAKKAAAEKAAAARAAAEKPAENATAAKTPPENASVTTSSKDAAASPTPVKPAQEP